MHKKRRFKERYVEYAIILTLIVIAVYATLYLYSTDSGNTNFKLTSDACHEFGGTCRSTCLDNEVKKTECGKELVCCVELFAASPEDKVYLSNAIDKINLTTCINIVNKELQASCQLKVIDQSNFGFAKSYLDRTYCDKIEEEKTKDNCLNKISQLTNNPKICNSIQSLTTKYRCITEIAKSKINAMLCLDITSEFLQNKCFKEVALDSKKIVLCDQITQKSEVKDCKLKVELYTLSKNYVKCINFAESECKLNERCKPVYFYPDCEGCPTRSFEICLSNNELLCEEGFGQWNILEESCNCHNKAWFDGFGCLDCNKFSNPTSKEECEQKLSA